MTNHQDLLADIDALIDEQLDAGEPVGGYDYDDPDFPKCGHCRGDWHGLAITERMQEMRWRGAVDADYRYSQDDSPVVCPGSEFIGPLTASMAPQEPPAGCTCWACRLSRTVAQWPVPDWPLDPAAWPVAVPSWTVSIGEPPRWWRLDAAPYRHRNLRFDLVEDFRPGRQVLLMRIDSGVDEFQGASTLEATRHPEHVYAATNYIIEILVSLDIHGRRPDDLGGRIVWHEIDGPGGDYVRSRAVVPTSNIDRWFDDRGLWFLAPREIRSGWVVLNRALDRIQRTRSFLDGLGLFESGER
ncbi:hypothetical protein [Gordonia sp. 4N]|uniref:hypothetical protein n=1 Tax=Gordonia sp. 4N TaxID=2993508 RepID=UPI0022495DE0|nr:hypothetical protein [Gordonia sp. 4N]MCX2753098.1 hypothetical protein [Gordonia sp. 4N]